MRALSLFECQLPGDAMELDSILDKTSEVCCELSINRQHQKTSDNKTKRIATSAAGRWKGLKKRQFKRQIKDLEASRLRQKTLVPLLCDALLGSNPSSALSMNYQAVMADWNTLLAETSVPVNAPSSSPYIIHAFKFIDNVVSSEQSSYLLRRLAYAQLMRLFIALEDIIRLERESGQMIRGHHYRDASIALDIYVSAQSDTSDPDELRRKLRKRRRSGRTWGGLCKPSPLLVLMYSSSAEQIIDDFEKVDNATLRLTATRILAKCPAEILHFCNDRSPRVAI
ncbi:hypothetical protein DER46DRAFT_532289 [Fusarium sp. MPI-SDFR-AT-0072]|nr:hypothetical protein DER46DRAFT_532289 [Fusarium sp. MPI-SDFR-AT-0072]